MSKTYCITTYHNRLCGCLLKDNRMFRLQIFSEESSILGNIYVGKVKNVIKNIDAAFVEIAGKKTCFLPMEEAQNPVLTNRVYDNRIVPGDEILVQVKKDAVKTKDPVLTANLSFPGRFCAVNVDGNKKIHYSHKLSKEQQKRLSAAFRNVTLPENISLVLRSSCETLEDITAVTQEAEKMLEEAAHIVQIGKNRTVYSCLTKEEPGYIKMLSQLMESAADVPDKIITDLPDVHTNLSQYIDAIAPEQKKILSLYQDPALNLCQLYGLDSKIKEATERCIWLKSGGYLVVEATEALIVIDVNSGKYTAKKNPQETFYKINLEAAEEIARQLQLRNLSGIIIVDFINMDKKEYCERLLEQFSAMLKEDPVTTRLIDMTPLGLVEITRKKVHRSLAEQLKNS